MLWARCVRRCSALVGIGAALAAIAVAPPSAGAAVEIGPERITVTSAGNRAVVTRRPFHVSFERSGAQVLSEVANTDQGPQVIADPDPELLGGQTVGAPTLYSPLSFTVGKEVNAQYPLFAWAGNLLLGLRPGIQYSARNVLSATRDDSGAKLTVSTNDPAGRRLVVRIAPDRVGTLRLDAAVTPGGGVGALSDSFASGPDEGFHGFGGRHNAINQRGNAFYSWVEQENVGAGPFQPVADAIPGGGGDRYLFPNGPTAAYYVHSLFISSRPYGFLLDQPDLARFRMASDREDAWNVAVAGSRLSYVVAPGAAPKTIRSLTEISGRQRTPPRWAAGPILDRLATPFTETEASYEKKVLQDLRDIRRYDVDLEAYRIEGWAILDRPVLKRVIAELREMGIRPLVYFRAFLSPDTAGTEDPADFGEAIEGGYVARTAAGTPYVYPGGFLGPTVLIDFTDPEAVRWWQRRITEALDLGAEGFMQDFGEQVLLDMHFDDGSTGRTMHNRYPVLYHRATMQAVRRYEREHPGRRIWYFTRTGYSGRPGSAAYEFANFPGDETTDWSRSSGIASIATDMLSRAVGGSPGYTMDIGGYFDVHTPATTEELFIRWTELAALTPYFRIHGSANAGTHTPWSYGERTLRIYKRLSDLHRRAEPLVMRLWERFRRTGMPITRPLWLAHPDDERATAQDQEWLLGRNLLVAPVVEEGATSRVAYLPAGCWRLRGRGPVLAGEAEVTVDAPLGRLPYFVRCGTSPLG